MLSVTGYGSKIIEELKPLLPEGEQIVASACEGPVLEEARRFVLCAGLLRPARLAMQTPEETAEAMEVNVFKPIRLCEHILKRFDDARICVVGSESAFTWSYDDAYAAAKVALHRYVETRKLTPKQQLICVAPSIIGDCGMTTRRTDLENLERRRQEHPKRRFLKAAEVARLIHFLLYVDEGYLSGQVIRMNGGV
jgi:NAD(P)-dependent dehydrogenase (short-subunit alcohol dehydrogenase family)